MDKYDEIIIVIRILIMTIVFRFSWLNQYKPLLLTLNIFELGFILFN